MLPAIPGGGAAPPRRFDSACVACGVSASSRCEAGQLWEVTVPALALKSPLMSRGTRSADPAPKWREGLIAPRGRPAATGSTLAA